jgi:hypothetical protein
MKKSSAVGFFGVAQSPKPSYGGTKVDETASSSLCKRIFKIFSRHPAGSFVYTLFGRLPPRYGQ